MCSNLKGDTGPPQGRKPSLSCVLFPGDGLCQFKCRLFGQGAVGNCDDKTCICKHDNTIFVEGDNGFEPLPIPPVSKRSDVGLEMENPYSPRSSHPPKDLVNEFTSEENKLRLKLITLMVFLSKSGQNVCQFLQDNHIDINAVRRLSEKEQRLNKRLHSQPMYLRDVPGEKEKQGKNIGTMAYNLIPKSCAKKYLSLEDKKPKEKENKRVFNDFSREIVKNKGPESNRHPDGSFEDDDDDDDSDAGMNLRSKSLPLYPDYDSDDEMARKALSPKSPKQNPNKRQITLSVDHSPPHSLRLLSPQHKKGNVGDGKSVKIKRVPEKAGRYSFAYPLKQRKYSITHSSPAKIKSSQFTPLPEYTVQPAMAEILPPEPKRNPIRNDIKITALPKHTLPASYPRKSPRKDTKLKPALNKSKPVPAYQKPKREGLSLTAASPSKPATGKIKSDGDRDSPKNKMQKLIGLNELDQQHPDIISSNGNGAEVLRNSSDDDRLKLDSTINNEAADQPKGQSQLNEEVDPQTLASVMPVKESIDTVQAVVQPEEQKTTDLESSDGNKLAEENPSSSQKPSSSESDNQIQSEKDRRASDAEYKEATETITPVFGDKTSLKELPMPEEENQTKMSEVSNGTTHDGKKLETNKESNQVTSEMKDPEGSEVPEGSEMVPAEVKDSFDENIPLDANTLGNPNVLLPESGSIPAESPEKQLDDTESKKETESQDASIEGPTLLPHNEEEKTEKQGANADEAGPELDNNGRNAETGDDKNAYLQNNEGLQDQEERNDKIPKAPEDDFNKPETDPNEPESKSEMAPEDQASTETDPSLETKFDDKNQPADHKPAESGIQKGLENIQEQDGKSYPDIISDSKSETSTPQTSVAVEPKLKPDTFVEPEKQMERIKEPNAVNEQELNAQERPEPQKEQETFSATEPELTPEKKVEPEQQELVSDTEDTIMPMQQEEETTNKAQPDVKTEAKSDPEIKSVPETKVAELKEPDAENELQSACEPQIETETQSQSASSLEPQLGSQHEPAEPTDANQTPPPIRTSGEQVDPQKDFAPEPTVSGEPVHLDRAVDNSDKDQSVLELEHAPIPEVEPEEMLAFKDDDRSNPESDSKPLVESNLLGASPNIEGKAADDSKPDKRISQIPAPSINFDAEKQSKQPEAHDPFEPTIVGNGVVTEETKSDETPTPENGVMPEPEVKGKSCTTEHKDENERVLKEYEDNENNPNSASAPKSLSESNQSSFNPKHAEKKLENAEPKAENSQESEEPKLPEEHDKVDSIPEETNFKKNPQPEAVPTPENGTTSETKEAGKEGTTKSDEPEFTNDMGGVQPDASNEPKFGETPTPKNDAMPEPEVKEKSSTTEHEDENEQVLEEYEDDEDNPNSATAPKSLSESNQSSFNPEHAEKKLENAEPKAENSPKSEEPKLPEEHDKVDSVPEETNSKKNPQPEEVLTPENGTTSETKEAGKEGPTKSDEPEFTNDVGGVQPDASYEPKFGETPTPKNNAMPEPEVKEKLSTTEHEDENEQVLEEYEDDEDNPNYVTAPKSLSESNQPSFNPEHAEKKLENAEPKAENSQESEEPKLPEEHDKVDSAPEETNSKKNPQPEEVPTPENGTTPETEETRKEGPAKSNVPDPTNGMGGVQPSASSEPKEREEDNKEEVLAEYEDNDPSDNDLQSEDPSSKEKESVDHDSSSVSNLPLTSNTSNEGPKKDAPTHSNDALKEPERQKGTPENKTSDTEQAPQEHDGSEIPEQDDKEHVLEEYDEDEDPDNPDKFRRSETPALAGSAVSSVPAEPTTTLQDKNPAPVPHSGASTPTGKGMKSDSHQPLEKDSIPGVGPSTEPVQENLPDPDEETVLDEFTDDQEMSENDAEDPDPNSDSTDPGIKILKDYIIDEKYDEH